MGVKQEDIDRAIASGNKFMAQLRKSIPEKRVEMVVLDSSAPPYSQQKLNPPKKKRIRQNTKGPNKLEREALEYLRYMDRLARTGFRFRTHALTLLLANGCRYTVDITAFGGKRGEIHAWEVKGKHSWDDAIVKLKVAAHEWPSISFYLMWKENGQWQTQHVLP